MTRPLNCRNQLREDGKAYPRSGCAVCKNGGLMGCPYERASDVVSVVETTAPVSHIDTSEVKALVKAATGILGVIAVYRHAIDADTGVNERAAVQNMIIALHEALSAESIRALT
jgi:hypothetical protein